MRLQSMVDSSMDGMLAWEPWGMEVDLTAMPDNRIHDFIKSSCSRPAPSPPFRVKINARVAAIMLGYIDEKLQRPASHSGVAYLMSVLKDGDWSETTHQGIAFTETQKLIDAQHRMRGIVAAGDGYSVWMWAFFGLPESDFACMDLGRKRSIADAIRAVGGDDPRSVAAMIVPLVFGLKCASHNPLSPRKAIDLASEHEDAVRFAVGLFAAKKRGVSAAINIGVVARAFYTQDRERLALFVKTLYEMSDRRPGRSYNAETDSAASVYANWISGGVPRGGGGRREHYGKMQSCLRHFLQYNPISKAIGVYDRELFPIPQDGQKTIGMDS